MSEAPAAAAVVGAIDKAGPSTTTTTAAASGAMLLIRWPKPDPREWDALWWQCWAATAGCNGCCCC